MKKRGKFSSLKKLDIWFVRQIGSKSRSSKLVNNKQAVTRLKSSRALKKLAGVVEVEYHWNDKENFYLRNGGAQTVDLNEFATQMRRSSE